jgi:hypothetical protein
MIITRRLELSAKRPQNGAETRLASPVGNHEQAENQQCALGFFMGQHDEKRGAQG